jgi:hypothetical protein
MSRPAIRIDNAAHRRRIVRARRRLVRGCENDRINAADGRAVQSAIAIKGLLRKVRAQMSLPALRSAGSGNTPATLKSP